MLYLGGIEMLLCLLLVYLYRTTGVLHLENGTTKISG